VREGSSSREGSDIMTEELRGNVIMKEKYTTNEKKV